MAIDWLVAPNGQEVNLIWIDGADPQAILNGFDFGINQACWDGSQWTISDAFFKDHNDKTISLIRSWEVPKRLRDRVLRMQTKFPEYRLLFEVHMAELKVYTVVYHTSHHEHTARVIAPSKWEASESVDGKVMHVSEGARFCAGSILSDSGWSFSFSTPQYREPSEQWRDYLLKRSFNKGFEDSAS